MFRLCTHLLLGFLFVFQAELTATPKIAVVGAGLAGLTTAYRLEQAGLEVQVYEARTRVGGRVLSASINGHIVELGGQNILDGGEAPHFLALLEEFQLPTTTQSILYSPLYFDGTSYIAPFSLLTKYPWSKDELLHQLNIAAEGASNLHVVLEKLFRDEPRLIAFFSSTLGGYEGARPETLSLKTLPTLYHMILGGISSVHPHHKMNEEAPSVSVQPTPDPSPIEFQSIEGGNSLLPLCLSKALKNPIRYGSALTSVRKLASSTLLAFSDGHQAEVDIVILAIPNKLLGSIDFMETLVPEKWVKDIQSLSIGSNAKLLVPAKRNLINMLQITNDRMGALSFGSSSILTLYYHGTAAHLGKKQVPDTAQLDFDAVTGIYPELGPWEEPAPARDALFQEYDGPVFHSWPDDPYAKGSYRYFGTSDPKEASLITQYYGIPVSVLFHPIDNSLFFAGEHTTLLLDAIGTMEAAVESGDRVAEMVLRTVDNTLK